MKTIRPRSGRSSPRRFPHTEPIAPAGPIRNHQEGRRLRRLNELVSSAISVAAPLTWPVVQFSGVAAVDQRREHAGIEFGCAVLSAVTNCSGRLETSLTVAVHIWRCWMSGVTITGWFLPWGVLVQGCRNFRRIAGVRSRGHACGRLSGWAGRCLKFGSRPSRSLRRSAARSLGWRFLPSGLRREGRNRAAGTSRRRPDYERPQQIRCSNSKPPAVARLVDSQMRKRRRSPVTRVVSTTATRRRRIRNFGAVTSSRTKVRHRHRCGENQTLSRKGKLK
jgi:hypothetical protein